MGEGAAEHEGFEDVFGGEEAHEAVGGDDGEEGEGGGAEGIEGGVEVFFWGATLGGGAHEVGDGLGGIAGFEGGDDVLAGDDADELAIEEDGEVGLPALEDELDGVLGGVVWGEAAVVGDHGVPDAKAGEEGVLLGV